VINQSINLTFSVA